MDHWFETLDKTYARVWKMLSRGVADRRSPARHPILATRGLSHGAEARVVVLRAAARADARIEFHTDSRSGKIAELAADPRCSLLIWDAKAHLQMRLRGKAAVITADKEAWQHVPEAAQRVYGGTPAPATPIASPQRHQPGTGDIQFFARVQVTLFAIETLHLGTDQHRRAVFATPKGEGRWLAP